MNFYQLKKLIFTQVDLPEYVEQECKIKLFRHDNGDYICRCPFPFHKDSKPSFSLQYRDGGWKWYCYGCSAGGTAVEFVMRYFSITLSEAVSRICDQFEISNDPKSYIEAMKKAEGTKSIKKEFESEFIRISSMCRNMLRDYPGDKETLRAVKNAYVDANEALEKSDFEKLKEVRNKINGFLLR